MKAEDIITFLETLKRQEVEDYHYFRADHIDKIINAIKNREIKYHRTKPVCKECGLDEDKHEIGTMSFPGCGTEEDYLVCPKKEDNGKV